MGNRRRAPLCQRDSRAIDAAALGQDSLLRRLGEAGARLL
jgi:hypothetical protein